MVNTLKKLLERAISDEHINYLEYNKFTGRTVIGTGSLGTVFKCKWKECELAVTLKCIRVDTGSDKKAAEEIINELKLLRRVSNHQNIIAFYGITKDHDGYYNIVLQYADEGNLREYLKVNFKRLQWTDKLRIAKEIAHGLLFLHDNNIIHRSLHSKNILIYQKQPKIADFGLSKQINRISMISDTVNHEMLAYVEPQCFTIPEYKLDKESDIYSFGVILWEISSGKSPFQSFETNKSLAHYIFMGNRENPMENTPPQYIELYKQCWDKKPSNRPETRLIFKTLSRLTTGENLNHPITNELFEITASSSTDPLDTIGSVYSHEITETTISPPETANPVYSHEITTVTTLPPKNDMLEYIRREAREYFNEGRYFEALELYEEILEDSQHNEEDQQTASNWNLSKKRLKNINELIKALYKNTTLTSLNLNNNKLGAKKGKALADALCKNTTLTSLNLIVNYLGPKGGKAIADALRENTTLTTLNLTYNMLGSEGGKALAEALCKNTSLTSLNLLNNKLESAGGKAFANALYNNNTLTSLNLYNNELGLEGGKAIAEAICNNVVLTFH